jgi:hypothetical protein
MTHLSIVPLLTDEPAKPKQRAMSDQQAGAF